ncbi:hypothetical protein RI543_004655 [Arxiozyma heterogenica]|uniref:Uncharacterized protein n=1 Tax=Arxiozyma heterogenica TaxID=278026 RepID=A0AAN7ZX16_9SACH|nr:hypothetical protein RI543_004655 [Kazachstania heterogenica]
MVTPLQRNHEIKLEWRSLKRNTGLQFDLNRLEQSTIISNKTKHNQDNGDWHPTAKRYLAKYFSVGESFYDYLVATLGSSKYFERR